MEAAPVRLKPLSPAEIQAIFERLEDTERERPRYGGLKFTPAQQLSKRARELSARVDELERRILALEQLLDQG